MNDTHNGQRPYRLNGNTHNLGSGKAPDPDLLCEIQSHLAVVRGLKSGARKTRIGDGGGRLQEMEGLLEAALMKARSEGDVEARELIGRSLQHPTNSHHAG